MGRLIVASNREPYDIEFRENKLKLHKTVGGLVSALEPIIKSLGGVWVCWGRKGQRIPDLFEVNENFFIKFVPLSEKTISNYYYGFSNKTLWPLCHMFLSRTRFEKSYWTSYKMVNMRFANAILDVYRDGDTVMINDYHLSLVPSIMRDKGFKGRIFFFWHIPFPSYCIYRFLPWGKEIIEGFLGADIIGFHTQEYVDNFLDCVGRFTDATIKGNIIRWKGREIKVKAVPIGIDAQRWQRDASSKNTLKAVKKMRRELNVEFIGLSVDRLDYTKGLKEKLLSIDRFFDKYPSFRGKMSFIQVAVPSRTKIQEYSELKKEIDQIISTINGSFGEPGWVPIHYYYKGFPSNKLAIFYRLADFALITPIMDGLNLVAKEFVASQIDNKGALILSKFAGASWQLKGGAILVNPFDTEKTADSIYKALKMGPEEKRRRMETMKKEVMEKDLKWWVNEFFEGLI